MPRAETHPVTRSMARATRARANALASRLATPEPHISLLTPPRSIRTYSRRRHTTHQHRLPVLESTPATPIPIAPVYTLPLPNNQHEPMRTSETPTRRILQDLQEVLECHGDIASIKAAIQKVFVDLSRFDAEETIRETRLGKISAALSYASQCRICLSFMQRPFVTQCGHTFCGPCLRTYFSRALELKLGKFRFLSFCHTSQYNAFEAPTSIQHLRNTLEGFEFFDANPRQAFTYQCPTCKGHIKVPPVDPVAFKQILSDIGAGLNGRQDLSLDPRDMVDESNVSSVGFFVGLFLRV